MMYDLQSLGTGIEGKCQRSLTLPLPFYPVEQTASRGILLSSFLTRAAGFNDLSLKQPLPASDHFVNNCFVSQSIFLCLDFLLSDYLRGLRIDFV